MNVSDFDFHKLIQELPPGLNLSIPPEPRRLFILSLGQVADSGAHDDGLPSERLVDKLRFISQALAEIADRVEDVRYAWFSINMESDDEEISESANSYDDVFEESTRKINALIDGIRALDEED